jgi:hypothetical protein
VGYLRAALGPLQNRTNLPTSSSPSKQTHKHTKASQKPANVAGARRSGMPFPAPKINGRADTQPPPLSPELSGRSERRAHLVLSLGANAHNSSFAESTDDDADLPAGTGAHQEDISDIDARLNALQVGPAMVPSASAAWLC